MSLGHLKSILMGCLWYWRMILEKYPFFLFVTSFLQHFKFSNKSPQNVQIDKEFKISCLYPVKAEFSPYRENYLTEWKFARSGWSINISNCLNEWHCSWPGIAGWCLISTAATALCSPENGTLWGRWRPLGLPALDQLTQPCSTKWLLVWRARAEWGWWKWCLLIIHGRKGFCTGQAQCLSSLESCLRQ